MHLDRSHAPTQTKNLPFGKRMLNKNLIILILSALIVSGCGDSRRDAFVQAQCGKTAVNPDVYDECREKMIDYYESMNP